MVYAQEKQKIFDYLVEQINKFDLYYEMSDSNAILIKYTDLQKEIVKKLNALETKDKATVYMELNLNGKQCWERYFKKD